jgi:hypothetical protein
MRAIIALATLVTAIVIGCRGLPQPIEVPRAHELRAGQLRFVCDFELPADHRLVRELAAERHEVAQTLGLAATSEPIVVYLFSDAERYRQFLSRYFPSVPSRRAFFIETDTTLAVYAHWSDRVAEDLRHEVAHGYLHAAAPGIPLWIDEGLAEYFEVPRGYGGLNRPHLDLLSDMATHGQWQPNLAKLEQLTNAGDMEQIDYAEAWAWVYFLLNSEPRKRQLLTDYVMGLSRHEHGQPLSNRLAALHLEPERTLTEYLAELPREGETR